MSKLVNKENSVYEKLKAFFKEKIVSGELLPGDKIWPEVRLAADFNVSRTTMRRALAGLEQEGLILRFPGKGTFVNKIETDSTTNGNEYINIGVDFFVPETGSYYWGKIAQGLQTGAQHNNMTLSFLPQEKLDRIMECGIDGLIFSHAPDPNLPVYKYISKGIIPSVGINCRINNKISCIDVDYKKESYKAVKKLIKMGHKKIAYIGSSGSLGSRNRYDGYREALKDSQLEICNSDIYLVPGPENLLSQIENLLKNNKISALFLSTAYYLLPVYHALNKLGIKAPDDIQLLCFDNLETMDLAEALKIAYIKMPLYSMGIRAAEYLKQKIILKEKAPVINETFAADLVLPK